MMPLLVDETPTTREPAAIPLQTGPVYHCFTCGAKARGLVHWKPCNSALDAWAKHIAYLNIPCACSGRVARLGDVITPLRFFSDADIPDFRARVAANVEAVAAAVQHLVIAAPPADRTMDPVERIVREVLAGLIPPDEAIQRIRSLASAAAET
jgi:hypothetical protein